MAVNTRYLVLSGSVDGLAIKVTAVATPGSLVHTCSSSPNDIDRICIKAYNIHTAPETLTLEWGGVTSPDNTIIIKDIPPQSAETIVVAYTPIQGNATPKVIRAFAANANRLFVFGDVYRVTQS